MTNNKQSKKTKKIRLPQELADRLATIGIDEKTIEQAIWEMDSKEAQLANLMRRWENLVREICGTYPPVDDSLGGVSAQV